MLVPMYCRDAETTRNALHGVNWPIGNGKQLIIDYATEEDVKKARNPALAVIQQLPEIKFPEKENWVKYLYNFSGCYYMCGNPLVRSSNTLFF